jgi:hypothetical protein
VKEKKKEEVETQDERVWEQADSVGRALYFGISIGSRSSHTVHLAETEIFSWLGIVSQLTSIKH